MILKIRYGQAWRFIDHVADVVVDDHVAHDGGQGARVFQTQHELREWIDEHYGVDRDFAAEILPLFGEGHHPAGVFEAYAVRPAVAHLHSPAGLAQERVLVLVGQEAYLLADNGDTIDRL